MGPGTQLLGPSQVGTWPWYQEAYRGRLLANLFNPNGLNFGGDLVVQTNISFVFADGTDGNYRGYFLTERDESIPVQGSFSMDSAQ